MKIINQVDRKYYKYTYDDPELINADGVVTSSTGGNGWTIYTQTGYSEVYLMLNASASSSYPRWQYSSPNVYAYIKTPYKGIISSYTTTQWCDGSETGRICNHWIIKGYETEADLLGLTNGTLISESTWPSISKGSSKIVNLASNEHAFQYYSIQMVSNFTGSSYCSIGSTKFYMKKQNLADGTPNDHDTYIDTNNYRVVNIPVRKYYKYSSTEFNGTQIGGTIADKKFTGASGAYLQVDDYYKLNSATSWEIQTKYTYNGGGTYPWIIDAYPSGISLYVYTTGQFALYVYNVFDVTSSVYASVGTTYYIKFGYNGSQYYCSYNTTGWSDTFTDIYRATSSNKLTFNYLYLMAMPSVDASARWSVGPMDLSETRIICGGKVVWNALQYSESASTDYDFYKDVNVYYGVSKQ